MNEDVENYLVMKSVEYMMYSLNLEDNYIHILKDRDYLSFFKEVIIAFNKLETIDDDIKDNVYKILIKLRYMDDLEYDTLQDINDIIRNLNAETNKKSVLGYYKDQLYLRTQERKYLKCDLKAIYTIKHLLFQSICNDYAILYTHIVSSEIDFASSLEQIDFNDYIASILVILEECPQVFKIEIFYQRVCGAMEILIKDENLDIKFNIKKIRKSIEKVRRK